MTIFTAEEASVLALIARYPDPKKRQKLIDKLQGKARKIAEALVSSQLQIPEDPEVAEIVYKLRKWANEL